MTQLRHEILGAISPGLQVYEPFTMRGDPKRVRDELSTAFHGADGHVVCQVEDAIIMRCNSALAWAVDLGDGGQAVSLAK